MWKIVCQKFFIFWGQLHGFDRSHHEIRAPLPLEKAVKLKSFRIKASYGLLNFLMLETTVITIYLATRHKFTGSTGRKQTRSQSNPREEVQVCKHQLHYHIIHRIYSAYNFFALNITFCRVDIDHIMWSLHLVIEIIQFKEWFVHYLERKLCVTVKVANQANT